MPTGYDTDFAGSFRCDDALLDRLSEKAVTTLALNMPAFTEVGTEKTIQAISQIIGPWLEVSTASTP